MAVDATMRKLQVPPRFMPYLEKHRIYELFHDLGNQLAMSCPEDPLVFLKQCLKRLAANKDKRLIILLAPPYMDTIKLAQSLSLKTGCDILSRYIVCLKTGDFFDSLALAENTANIIRDSDKDGWILADYPRNEKEAKHLIKCGVIPTHSFWLVPEEKGSTALSCYDMEEQDYKENEKLQSLPTTQSLLMEFDNSIHRLKELFSSSLKIVNTNDKDLTEVANTCARLTMKMPLRQAPKLFRVVLIGPRGSRRRTIAKILNRKYNLVHVDMENLISVGQVMENGLGDEIRRFDINISLYPTRIVFELLKNRLSKEDCLERGYVLTNFPTCVEDFVLLDSMMDSPPNRVIFLNIEGHECQERLEDRVVNENSGKLYSKKRIVNEQLLKAQTFTHPDDEECKVTEEIKFYKKRVGALQDYCGSSSWNVDARGPISAVVERVEAVLMSPSPAAQPRSGVLPTRHSHSLHDHSPRRQSQGPHGDTEYRMSYPVSRTDVVPLIEPDDMMRRYNELKSGTFDHPSELMTNRPTELAAKEYYMQENTKSGNTLTDMGTSKSSGSNRNDGSRNEFHTIIAPSSKGTVSSVSGGLGDF